MNPIKKFVANKLFNVIQAQGELVSKEQGETRLAVCRKCKYKGKVEPIPHIKLDGCTICECPLATKAFMKWIWRSNNHKEEPLDIEEILELMTLKKFKPENFYKHKISCPFPKVDKWTKVDSNFLKFKN